MNYSAEFKESIIQTKINGVRPQCGQFKQFGSMTNFEIMVIKNFYSVST